MKKLLRVKPILGLMLVLSLVATSLAPATAVNAEQGNAAGRYYELEKVDNGLVQRQADDLVDLSEAESEMQFADDEVVRVSIVLDGTSVIDAGYSTEELAANAAALELIEEVYEEQKSMEEKIDDVLGEGTLDVQWNLAVAANIISADVTYGDIAAIAEVEGVKEVIVEAKYLPCSPSTSDDPDMAVSSNALTGVIEAWAKGQTGAGGRVAIIDTGLDIYHQSFNNDAFLYALKEDAKNAFTSYNNYLKKIDLLDAGDIEKVLPLLNAYAKMGENITAEDFVISEKIPYAFNYVDSNTNVEHIYDGQGEHGSHVAGIAASNRYLKTENGFVDALETVGVAGNAPDAQVIVMKVFGQGGGAYDSDYMAAIEDAILLGADSVNLSLGSAAPGFTTSPSYQDIMDKLTSTDTVVVMSAGNSGSWADETPAGLLYNDDVSFNTAGSPGSFTNSLGVASVNNYGMVSRGITVDGNTFSYSESATYGNKELATLCGDNDSVELDYVFVDGMGQPSDFEGIDLSGKVVFCSRGAISFFEKANNAVSKGAAATIIYNNTTGTIGLNLTGYSYTAPCVSITQDDAAVIRSSSESNITADGREYFTGKITLSKKYMPFLSNAEFLEMSSFSSWGVPGDLSMKPEITAPGGNIYSVAGSNVENGVAKGGYDQYELMSGTSMAAPQITGMMAVLKRYVETTWYKKFPKISHRALAQSLLMSTATPIVGESGSDVFMYSVLKQGAGLANVSDAMNAATFVMMDENATKSYADGKIKAELGDDPDRTGVYKFGFTLTNMTSANHTYMLDDYVFTQGLTFDNNYNLYLTDETTNLDADVTFYVNGKDVSNIKEQVNPYTAQLDAAEKELAAADRTYNDAVEAAAAADAAVAKAVIKQADAAVKLTAAQAELTAAKLNEALAKARRKLDKNGEKLYQDAVAARKAAETKVKTAETDLKNANAEAKKAESAANAANKPVAAALKKVNTAQAKIIELKAKEAAWAPKEVKNGVIVGPNKEVKVDVVIKLTDETKEILDTYYPAGAYVEAFISAESQDNTSSHSIPVLAYYGSWTDPSMFDKGSYLEYKFGLETRKPYLGNKNANSFTVNFGDGSGEYYFGGNLYANTESYNPTFAALNNQNGDSIKNVQYALIRNAGQTAVVVQDAFTGELYHAKYNGSQTSAYYYVNGAAWRNTSAKAAVNWKGTDINGNPLPENTTVIVSLVAAPEYYVEDGAIDFARLGDGALFSTLLTIDNTAPEISVQDGKIFAIDNQVIAAIGIYSDGGKTPYLGGAVDKKGFLFDPEGLEEGVYVVEAIDYAGNTSTYRLLIGMELTDEVESVELNQHELLLMKNSSAKLAATVNPVNISDDTVVWTSTDESVATVDGNGVVTAVGLGECDIIAAANLDETYYDVCHVTVIEISKELNGVVWDEVGKVWFSEFNTANLPEYTKLTETSANAPINGLAYGADGTLYATDFDSEEGLSNLYTVDPSTFELSMVGASSIGYTDIAEAPGMGVLIGTYLNYVVLVDPNTGDYMGAFNYAGNNLVGITYIGSQYHPSYRTYLDMYYLLDDAGNMYFEAFIKMNGSYYYFNGADEASIGNIGVTCDVPYFQSLYFDGEYTFVSSFNESKNVVEFFAVDTEDTGAVYKLGEFANGVWPVAALCKLAPAGGESAKGENFAEMEVKTEASTEAIEKIDIKPLNK